VQFVLKCRAKVNQIGHLNEEVWSYTSGLLLQSSVY